MSETGWEDILDPNEKIIWQGRPDAALRFKPKAAFTTLFGLAFAGFALFWMNAASQAGGHFWMFGLIHFAAGIGIIFGPIFGPSYMRRHTWYTLTNSRAFIAVDAPIIGRKLKSYPITESTPLELDGGTPGSIFFASKTKRHKNGTYTVPVGFEAIDDPTSVMALMRQIQKGQITQ